MFSETVFPFSNEKKKSKSSFTENKLNDEKWKKKPINIFFVNYQMSVNSCRNCQLVQSIN